MGRAPRHPWNKWLPPRPLLPSPAASDASTRQVQGGLRSSPADTLVLGAELLLQTTSHQTDLKGDSPLQETMCSPHCSRTLSAVDESATRATSSHSSVVCTGMMLNASLIPVSALFLPLRQPCIIELHHAVWNKC